MDIHISSRVKRAYVLRGQHIEDRLWQPIIKDRSAKCTFNIKITDVNRQGELEIQPSLVHDTEHPFLTGTPRRLSLNTENHTFEWDFIPQETENVKINLNIDVQKGDRIYDDYGTLIIGSNYTKPFAVRSYFEYFLFYFAGISTIGAIAEIINLLITAKILKI